MSPFNDISIYSQPISIPRPPDEKVSKKRWHKRWNKLKTIINNSIDNCNRILNSSTSATRENIEVYRHRKEVCQLVLDQMRDIEAGHVI